MGKWAYAGWSTLFTAPEAACLGCGESIWVYGLQSDTYRCEQCGAERDADEMDDIARNEAEED